MYGRNGQSICLLSPFFCPSSKIAQPKYAKGASERARSASVYGIPRRTRLSTETALRGTTEWIFKKRGYEGDDFLFRTVIKISKIQFSQFLHTSASKFSHGRLPNHSLLPAKFEFLFYIVLLRSKILVLFSWDFQAGNSKF